MNYHKIDNCNMNNGAGIRVVLWVSGCSHHCPGCFNAQTWDEYSGDQFGPEQLAMIKDALKEDWCSGITLSGGDPLFWTNRKDIKLLCKELKEEFPTKTIWLYTGYVYEELIKMATIDTNVSVILKTIDVLCDGRFIEERKSPDKHWVGSDNQRVIDMKKTIKTGEVVLLRE